jgi:hypothetical protein
MSSRKQGKVHWVLRWLAAIVAILICQLSLVGYFVARAINLNYFKDPHVPVSAQDVLVFLIAAYLLTLAMTGRWRLLAKR